jgi:hypothetical protein
VVKIKELPLLAQRPERHGPCRAVILAAFGDYGNWPTAEAERNAEIRAIVLTSPADWPPMSGYE